MDLSLASKLIKYNPQDVQSVTYTVEYAQHNYVGDALVDYLHEHLKSNAQYEIAQAILGETALADTIKNKPSDASGKISEPKEKQSTTGTTSPAMKSIEAKGDAKKVGFKGGLEGTGTNVVQKEEVSDWMTDVVEELGEDFDQLTDEDLEDLIFEALEELDSESLIIEAVDALDGLEVLTEAPSKDSVLPNVAVQAPQKKAAPSAAPRKAGRLNRLANAAKRVGSAVKSGLKSTAKGAVRGAGYASGLAQRAVGSPKSEFAKGRERGLKGGSSTGGSSTSSSTGTTGSSSGGSTSTTTGGSSSTGGSSTGGASKKPSLLRRAAGAIGRGIKKVAGKTARGISKVSGKVANKLGEEQKMDSKVNRIRKMLAIQETIDHERSSATWRDRLGWDLEEEKTASQKEKSAALEKTKALTNSGKHKEASDLFKKHFPNFGK